MLGKESIIDLADYLNTKVRVRMIDREVVGTLKSYDKIPNLVLENTIDETKNSRELGIVFVRGQMIISIMPDKLSSIENPFK
ncbi:hypothetical protein SteCoe_32809 [Stentor coeruleus]|uniref:Sm domain-containing protein n=1 Tax=Stentor coeruleus TaxID=5963 RepID=A0A1R2AY82_9CILI|nr:hypothetical protein SteCoe_32809 [Stentor coeruleus]